MNRPPIRSVRALHRRLRALFWLQCSGFHLPQAAAPNGAPAGSTRRCVPVG